MTTTPTIFEFQGNYRFLSNFWPANVLYEGIMYPSVEHAYQAAHFLSLDTRLAIRDLPSPGQAKRAMKTIDAPRIKNWQDVSLDIMHQLVLYKFTHNPELRKQLLATGDAMIIEGNAWHDTFWGVCDGVGQNHLGKILMDVRAQLANETES